MTVKRLNGHRRKLKPLLFNPYKADLPKFTQDNGTPVIKGVFPRRAMELLGFRKCCVCGFYERNGVVTENGFICTKDFDNDAIFSPAKVILKNGLHYHPSKSLENWI